MTFIVNEAGQLFETRETMRHIFSYGRLVEEVTTQFQIRIGQAVKKLENHQAQA